MRIDTKRSNVSDFITSSTPGSCSTLFRADFALAVICLIASLQMFPAIAVAQSSGVSTDTLPVDRAGEEGLRRQEERQRELQQKLESRSSVLKPAQKAEVITGLPEETPCFIIHEIEFIGPDAHWFNWLQETVSPFSGRCIGVAGLRRIAEVLDGELIDTGYATTRVSLPEQNLSNGKIAFRMHVGRIAEVRMERKGQHSDGKNKLTDDAWGTWWTAFPLGAGDILNIRALEQGVEQMQRLPSQSVSTRIEPGPAPDTSVVVIERSAGSFWERLRGGVTLDNSSSKSLGRTQFSSHVTLDNALGLNDILSLTASTNAENPDADHRSQSLAASYSIPFGYSAVSLSKSHSRFAQNVQGTTARFLSSGESMSDEIRLHHTVARTSSAKFGVYAALSARRAKSFLDDVELIIQRRRTTNIETGVTYRQLIGRANLDLELGYRRGMPWRDAQDDFPSDIANGLTLRPKIWSLSLGYSQLFTVGAQPFHYNATLRAQHTANTTLSVDQIAIGGRYSVRGFDGDAVLLAENGSYLRNDFIMPVRLAEGIDGQAYLGLDIGRVWGPSDINLVGNKLAGAAIGLRSRWKALQIDMALGTPLYKPSGFRTRHVNPYVALTYAF